MGDFDAVFTVFFMDCPFRQIGDCPLLSPNGATIFAKLPSQIVKTPEISGQVCVFSINFISYRQQRDFNKIPLHYFRAENIDVHL